jgi:hypothetical protein
VQGPPVMKDQGLQGPGAGMTANPSRASTSAASRPPFNASPTIWGASHRPVGAGGWHSTATQQEMSLEVLQAGLC